MAAYEEEDVTLIQIMDDDKLSEKETYLNYYHYCGYSYYFWQNKMMFLNYLKFFQ